MAQRAREHAFEARDHTRHHAQNFFQKLKKHNPGPLGWLGILAAAGIVAVIAVIALIVLTPVFIFFSPILVPLGFVLFLGAAGVLTVGGVAVAVITAISWAYKYFKGRHPPGSEQVDYAVRQIQDTAEHVKHKARDMGGQIHSRVHEAVPDS